MRFFALGLVAALALGGIALVGDMLWPRPAWSEAELATLRSLWIASLGPVPADPSNRVADDPRAVTLGHKLFFDARFSSTGTVACASCHLPGLDFTDGLPLARGVGTTPRTTMPIAGTQYAPFLFWDGRKDSQWAQALGPLESPVEHGGSRSQYAHLVATHYRNEYEALFGPLPDLSDTRRFPPTAGPVEDAEAHTAWERMSGADRQAVTRVYANLGKAIAAYERRLIPGPARFDTYVEAALRGDRPGMAQALTDDEVAGLRLFIGRAACTTCHLGPLFTNHAFQNTGVPAHPSLPPDAGRADGARQVLADEFNCLSPFSDARPEQCSSLRFLKVDGHEMERQFKVPSLRNVARRRAFMHAGQFSSLREVLAHYNRAPAAPAGHTELKPLNLSETELRQIELFLRSLSGDFQAPPELLAPPLS